MISAAFAMAISGCTGWCVVAGLWHESPRSLGHFVLRLSVSMGVGLFLSSLVYFICLILGMTQRPIVIGFDLLSLAGAYTFLRSRRGQIRAGLPELVDDARLPLPLRRGLLASLATGLAFNAIAWLYRFADEPMGFWDAFAIWNLKARFFYLEGGAHWQRAFHSAISWSHTDYPLLLPLNVARLWLYEGNFDLALSAALSALFTLLAIGAVLGAVAIARSLVAAAFAALALLATPELMGQGVWQVADIPVGFYLAATLAFLSLCKNESDRAAFLLAGLAAGSAAWTKNEGILMALSVLIGILCFGPGAGLRDRARPGALYLAGLALPLAFVIAMKVGIGGESDLAMDTDIGSLARVLDLTRHQIIMASFVNSLLTLAGLPLAAGLAGLWFWQGFDRDTETRPIIGIGAFVLAVQLSGYYFIYLITDRDLAWHLGTSNLRIFVQLWPSAILLFFMALRPISLPRSIQTEHPAEERLGRERLPAK
jgi:hypothetical protein